jgi:hypothetical protein
VKAFCTDGLSVDVWGLGGLPYEESVHHVFLERGIPIIEQLTNVAALVGMRRSIFVGFTLEDQRWRWFADPCGGFRVLNDGGLTRWSRPRKAQPLGP